MFLLCVCLVVFGMVYRAKKDKHHIQQKPAEVQGIIYAPEYHGTSMNTAQYEIVIGKGVKSRGPYTVTIGKYARRKDLIQAYWAAYGHLEESEIYTVSSDFYVSAMIQIVLRLGYQPTLQTGHNNACFGYACQYDTYIGLNAGMKPNTIAGNISTK